MYRGGPGGEACEDERKLKNVTETVYDACHGPFFVLSGKLYLFFVVLLGVLFFLPCQESCICFFDVLSGTMRCPGVCTGLQRQNNRLGPENADKSGKKAAKNEVFGHRELKLFRGTRKSAIFGSHRAKILL